MSLSKLKLLLPVLMFMFLFGCATITHLYPQETRKGYVDFYNISESELVAALVYEIREGGREKWVGKVGVWHFSQPRRVVTRPGVHKFRVEAGTSSKIIEVEVLEDMVTQVMIITNVKNVEFSTGFSGSGATIRTTRIHFTRDFEVLPPVPFYKYGSLWERHMRSVK